MKHNEIRSNDSRTTAKCIRATWMARERNTAPVLIRRLAEKGIHLQLKTYPDDPPSSNVFTAAAMGTLLPGRFSDAFFSVLSDSTTAILPTNFAYHLYRRPTDEMQTWRIVIDLHYVVRQRRRRLIYRLQRSRRRQ